MDTQDDTLKVRLDKWLWAARFYKTRAVAAEAISGGKVHLNGARVKPARMVAIGQELRIRRGEQEFTIIVQGLSKQRRPASEATLLYSETEQSVAEREEKRQQRREQKVHAPQFRGGRPSKKARRQLDQFNDKHQSD